MAYFSLHYHLKAIDRTGIVRSALLWAVQRRVCEEHGRNSEESDIGEFIRHPRSGVLHYSFRNTLGELLQVRSRVLQGRGGGSVGPLLRRWDSTCNDRNQNREPRSHSVKPRREERSLLQSESPEISQASRMKKRLGFGLEGAEAEAVPVVAGPRCREFTVPEFRQPVS